MDRRSYGRHYMRHVRAQEKEGKRAKEDSSSSESSEDSNEFLKKKVRSGKNPLAQIAKRISEIPKPEFTAKYSKNMASHSKKPPFFAVVEFKAEKSMAVVYSEWFIKGPEKADMCYWPPKNATALAIKKTQPNLKWNVYCVRMFAKFDTFDEAHRSMEYYEEQSDAPESSAEQQKKRNTVKPPRFLTTDDDDGDVDDDTGADDGDDGSDANDANDDDDDESILVPNQGHKKGTPVPPPSHRKQQPSEKDPIEADHQQTQEVEIPAGPSYSVPSRASTPTSDTALSLSQHVSRKRKAQDNSYTGTSLNAKVDMLLENQQTIIGLLRKVVSRGSREGDEEDMEETLKQKCATVEALMEFDKTVADDKNFRLQMIAFLTTVDGNSTRELVKKMLLAITTTDVLRVFSLRGQKRHRNTPDGRIDSTKKGIDSMAVYNVIKRACRRKDANNTELVVDKALAEYLKANAKNSTMVNRSVNNARVTAFSDED